MELPNQNFSNAFGDNIRDAFDKATRERDALIAKAKKASGNAKKELEKAADKAKDAVQKLEHQIKDGFKDWKTISNNWNKFNPAATVPRAAALALVRLNFLGIARKLNAGILSEEELKAKHYNLQNAAIVRKLWETTVKDNWEALGGDISALKKAVQKGFNKPVFKTKKVKAAQKAERGESFDGGQYEIKNLSPFNKWANEFDLSVADNSFKSNFHQKWHNDVDPTVIAALIAAGGGIVIAALNASAKKAGAKDNPYDPNSAEYKLADQDPSPIAPPLTAQDDEYLKQIELVALEDKRKSGLDPGTYEAEFEAIERKYSKFLGMPKPIGIAVAVIGGLALIFGGYKLYKHLKK